MCFEDGVVVVQYLFQQLGVIVAIVKLHIRTYLDDIFELIKVSCVHLIHTAHLHALIVIY